MEDFDHFLCFIVAFLYYIKLMQTEVELLCMANMTL